MAPDGNFKSMLYNPFTVNDFFFLILKAIQISIFIAIFLLLIQNISIQTKFVNVLNVSVKTVSFLHVNIRSINKNFETFKNFYSKLNCTFRLICFSKTWAADNSISNDSNFQTESYSILLRKRESGRGGELSIFLHKEVYFKLLTNLSINSNDVELLCIEIHHKKEKNILFSVMFRPSNGDMTVFEKFGGNFLSPNDETSKSIIFAGDLNINVLD